MQGGTTFHFVDQGIEVGPTRPLAARGGDVRIGDGPAMIQPYLRVGLMDELHVAIVPILLGGGGRLFEHLDGQAFGYDCVEVASSPVVAHVRLVRKRAA